jgi:hypothetical protein
MRYRCLGGPFQPLHSFPHALRLPLSSFDSTEVRGCPAGKGRSNSVKSLSPSRPARAGARAHAAACVKASVKLPLNLRCRRPVTETDSVRRRLNR